LKKANEFQSPPAPPGSSHRCVARLALPAADVFTESTTFWVMESIRLDRGYGSQVHS
jgi:hypothetical protein